MNILIGWRGQAWALLLAVPLVSCSNKQLSDDQKQAMRDTMDSSGRAYAAARNLSTDSFQMSANVAVNQMTSILKQRIKTAQCKLKFIAPSGSAGRSHTDTLTAPRTFMLLKISGSGKCPIDMDLRVKTQFDSSMGRWVMGLDYDYSVTDESYRRLNDIDLIQLHGGVNINGLNGSKPFSSVNMTGEFHSQKVGTIGISVQGDVSGAKNQENGSTSWRFEFSDFFAEFKQTLENGSMKFTLNTEDIHPQEFSDYFSRGGEPFLYSLDPKKVLQP